DRVVVDDAVEAAVLALQRDPVAHGAEVVAEVHLPRRLNTGEHRLHCLGCLDGTTCKVKNRPWRSEPCFGDEFMSTLNGPISRRVQMTRSLRLAGPVFTLAMAALASGCVVRAAPAPVAVSGGVYVDGSSDYATVYPTSFAPEPVPEFRPAPP